ncbi:MAG: peptidoglycan DD-metalloendopeptidase family protein [Alkalispirochaeta sp.]
MNRWRYIAAVLVAFIVIATAWWIRQPEEVVEPPFQPRESHQVYREALDQLSLGDTAMGQAWIAAADEAMEAPPAVTPPLTETVRFDPRDPGALSYWFPVTRGRRVVIDIDAEHDYYFADVFRLAGEGSDDGSEVQVEELAASRPADENRIVFEARANGFYLFRLQPELLRGGQFDISITEGASLAFPVEGATYADIWSFFGDGRDAGSREHHGVDVFAPRGTPVLAVSDSEVIRVGERERGGNIVTLRDDARGIMLYYAHLDEQLVSTGARVSAGDVIGTVGNTGNAITTPPHLHIGIYQGGWRRPVDPWGYFVDPPAVSPRTPSPEAAARIGTWIVAPGETLLESRVPAAAAPVAQVQNRNPYLRGAGDTFAGAESAPDPELQPPPLRRMPVESGAPLFVVGVAGEYLRVRSLNGGEGFVPISERLLADRADRITVSEDRRVRDIVSGDTIALLTAGESVALLADIGGGEVVRLESGRVAVLTY